MRSNFHITKDNQCVSIMNKDYSEHDEVIFNLDEILPLAQFLSNELGINDLLKLRDHVEQKIKEIYSVKQDDL